MTEHLMEAVKEKTVAADDAVYLTNFQYWGSS